MACSFLHGPGHGTILFGLHDATWKLTALLVDAGPSDGAAVGLIGPLPPMPVAIITTGGCHLGMGNFVDGAMCSTLALSTSFGVVGACSAAGC